MNLDVTIPSVAAAAQSPPEHGEKRCARAQQPNNADVTAFVVDSDAAPDELLMLKLAADEVRLLTDLDAIKANLAEQLHDSLGSGQSALAFAKLLREVVRIDVAVARKVRDALLGAADLRARRHFLERMRDADV